MYIDIKYQFIILPAEGKCCLFNKTVLGGFAGTGMHQVRVIVTPLRIDVRFRSAWTHSNLSFTSGATQLYSLKYLLCVFWDATQCRWINSTRRFGGP